MSDFRQELLSEQVARDAILRELEVCGSCRMNFGYPCAWHRIIAAAVK